jgi:hypothetical protein
MTWVELKELAEIVGWPFALIVLVAGAAWRFRGPEHRDTFREETVARLNDHAKRIVALERDEAVQEAELRNIRREIDRLDERE